MAAEPFRDLPLASARRLDRLCRQFEGGWQSGGRPRLEDYLAQSAEEERAALLGELLSLELEYRHRGQEPLRLEDYLSRFPGDNALVTQVWRDSDLPSSCGPPASLVTGSYQPGGGQRAEAAGVGRQHDDPTPQDVAAPAEGGRIGRYRIEKVLGKGAFGLVYLARDEQLDRSVAVKVPHPQLVSRPEYAEVYQAEARTVANLDHPNIVPVHDVGSTEDCPCYVVSKYVEGTDLATKIKEGHFQYTEAAELVATVAEALHYAHTRGLVHRDVKPGNILIGNDGKPHVVDFGLALREEGIGKGPNYAGTPAYMSPEQARGEGHRVDGRSDIFSLGVVFYEVLAGRRPFHGDTKAELLEQVTSYEPRPLRQYDEKLPRELERICFKAMAKRASERYATGHDMAEDLRHFLAGQKEMGSAATPSRLDVAGSQTPASTPTPATTGSAASASASPGLGSSSDSQLLKVVPKGLRSFDAHDADFFLDLLPGPRDRRGLPECVRFWKIRIEETDPDQTFAVGLLYGPSGCGKSSLVKAGLLPRLSEGVISVYLEATANETEARLLERLRKRFPTLADKLNLQETLAALRQGQGLPAGKKVLLVLDQFEQWLHARRGEENTDLAQALRQCDGGRVQCLVMVRDDFWLAISRFLRELEVRLVEGHNSTLVDLFDLDHARKVLAAFGRAFGKLPENVKDTTREQKDFLKQSVQGLAEEGKVICVRLALFAEMMKGKPWTSAGLKEVGGTAGVGVTFLEETFSSSTASPEHRYHEKAARAVLTALLPDAGTSIKGEMKSSNELLEASGYARSPKDFDDLILLLDRELRLITPADPEGVASEGEPVRPTEAGQKYFQLTHDYLVHSLRDWLTRKQKETRRGRAELQFMERSLLWHSKPENQLLPSLWEYLNTRLLINRRKWSAPQRKMMRSAGRFHGVRAGLAIAILLIVGLATWEVWGRFQAATLVQQLASADISQVPNLGDRLTHYRRWADPLLRERFQRAEEGSPEKLHLALALLPVDDSQVDYLREQLPTCTLAQFPVVRDALLPHKESITDALWQGAENEHEKPSRRFQAAAALAAFVPGDRRWQNIAPFVANHLTNTIPPVQFGSWLVHLQPASEQLDRPLADILANRNNSEKQRETVANTLAYFLKEKPDRLAHLIPVADNHAAFSPLIDALRPYARDVKPRLMAEIHAAMKENPSTDERDAHWERQSLAAVALVHLGHGDVVWPMLESKPDPSLRSFITFHLGKLQCDHNVLAGQLQVEQEASIRRALLQALGGLDPALIPAADRVRIAEHVRALYLNDPDPGIHGSASWTLRQWGLTLPELSRGAPQLTAERKQRIARKAAEVAEIRRRLTASPQQRALLEEQLAAARKALHAARWEGARRWYVNGQKQTFVVIPSPAAGGSGSIKHSFAIAVHEVTAAEFLRFHPEHRQLVRESIVVSDDCPVHQVTWYAAAAYCNWLSEQEGIPKEQWVYLPNDSGEFAEGMRIKENYAELSGYRLPTEAEWEHACRGGARGTYCFGEPLSLLRRYAKYVLNSEGHSHPVGSLLPNELGLFDMHGNFWEWSQDVSPDALSPVRNEKTRVLRGGSIGAPPSLVESKYRLFSKPDFEHIRYGFRVARTYPESR